MPAPDRSVPAPLVEVVGLGPAAPGLLTQETAARLASARHLFLRTSRHPSADELHHARSFDGHYEDAPTFEAVYLAIVEDLITAARELGHVVYAVPGSPTVAERTVELLREHDAVRAREVALVVHPALSFLDLAFERLAVDPVGRSVRIVDAGTLAVDAAGSCGPLIVAQCWDRSALSAVKLAPEVEPSSPVTVLYHLGLPDEKVWEVGWEDLDRSFVPDHLTSLWIPELGAPVAAELVRLEELVRVLRERCPWDRRQTHGTLRRHLLEESYEVLETLDEVAAFEPGVVPAEGASPVAASSARGDAGAADPAEAMAALEEELGDLLFQIYFHARLAAESGYFTLADVARGVHDKLVHRHPHVFGDEQITTAEEVADTWEMRKLAEKNRVSVTEGIPIAMPALAHAAKLQRKAAAVGMVLPSLADEAERAARMVAGLVTAEAAGETAAEAPVDQRVGDALFAVVSVARDLGVDPESALRTRLSIFRREVDAAGLR